MPSSEVQREVKQKKQQPKKRKRRDDESSDEEEEGEEEDGQWEREHDYETFLMAYTTQPLSEFDYDAMDDEVWEESEEEEEERGGGGGGGKGMSEAELEKLLLQNLSDEEEGDEMEESGGKSTRKSRSEPTITTVALSV